MKTTLLLTLLIAGLASMQAQTNNSTPAPAPVENSQPQGCPSHHAKKNALANLSETERAQFKAAMKQIKNDPKLVSARQAVKEAQTKEAKVAAHQALQQTRHDLLLMADPTIQPVLDKISSGKSNPADQ